MVVEVRNIIYRPRSFSRINIEQDQFRKSEIDYKNEIVNFIKLGTYYLKFVGVVIKYLKTSCAKIG